MKEDITVATLLAIWNELPTLAGSNWERLESRLKALLETFDAAPDSRLRYKISLDIQRTLGTFPEVIARFDEEYIQMSNKNFSEVRKNFNLEITNLLRRGMRPGKTFTRYTDISCPRRVWVQTPRIVVVVRLTMHPSVYSNVKEELLVQSEVPVRVRVDAPAFEFLGSHEQEIPIQVDLDSLPIVFDLRPQQICHTFITFDFFQNGNPVGTASIPVEITANEVSITNEQQQGPLLRSMSNVDPPDFILYITYERFLTSPTLFFELRPVGGVGQKFRPIPLQSTPEEYAEQIYRRLKYLTTHTDPTVHTILGKVRELDPQDAEDRLKEEGQNLWRYLIPPELQARYAMEREQWRNKSLLIVSDEPHIPWELLWPSGKWSDEGPLCLQMRISRWLRREPQGNANSEPEPSLHMGELAVVVPPDSGLSAARSEQMFLRNLIKRHHLLDASPAEPSRAAVKKLLQEGRYTWLHVAAHGNFYSADPGGESAIWLLDKVPLTSNAIVGEIENHIREHRPAFVFNACEVGRQGWAITGLDGWADRLIGAGAGLFLAPLWIVNDGAAFKFSKAVYQLLFEGETVAEAVRQGRISARREGDPSWLAYSLYAHPNARVIVPELPVQ